MVSDMKSKSEREFDECYESESKWNISCIVSPSLPDGSKCRNAESNI